MDTTIIEKPTIDSPLGFYQTRDKALSILALDTESAIHIAIWAKNNNLVSNSIINFIRPIMREDLSDEWIQWGLAEFYRIQVPISLPKVKPEYSFRPFWISNDKIGLNLTEKRNGEYVLVRRPNGGNYTETGKINDSEWLVSAIVRAKNGTLDNRINENN